MPCTMCKQRGKTWNGSDPRCAFEEDIFSSDNWNCATMNALRDLVRDSATYNDDQYAALLPFRDECRFLVLSWYKSLGCTEGAWVIDSERVLPLILKQAESIIEQYREKTLRKRNLQHATALLRHEDTAQ